MRLGGPVFTNESSPESWIQALKKEKYRSAVFPLTHNADGEMIRKYVEAAANNDIVIAEVGAWSNPISTNEKTQKAAMEVCKNQLDLAEKTGAVCCVNIAGSRGEQWDGPDPDNYSDETFALIVDSVREIIDAVKPNRTYYTLETMPWIVPDSADSYLELIKAVDRKAFAVHLDPVNLITSPRTFYQNGLMVKDFVKKLGVYIKSSHAKDIQLSGKFMVHLDEVIPGTGGFDYRTLLKELYLLNPEMPLIIEHLTSETEYQIAASLIRKTAAEVNVPM